MADFCMDCSLEIFGEDLGDLAGLGNGKVLQPGYGWVALCEGCGPILVDSSGKKLPPPKECEDE